MLSYATFSKYSQTITLLFMYEYFFTFVYRYIHVYNIFSTHLILVPVPGWAPVLLKSTNAYA